MLKNFAEVKNALASGKSVLDIVNEYIATIHSKKHFNIFVEVFEDSARQQATLIDEKIANGTAGRLAGMVIGIKDNICYKGHVVTAASKILENFESLFTATALQRLIDEDAVIVGRLNCDEFSMGGTSESSVYGPVINPLDESRISGGSSGGSGAAVAANLCTVALGTDTGGSIRQPASFTGTYGFKPTYGRISRYGIVAHASSFDQLGVIGNSLEDVALTIEVMAGKDEMDNTSSSKTVENLQPVLPQEKLKIAVIKEYLENPALHPTIKTAFGVLVDQLKADGHEINEVSFPYADYLAPCYYTLTTGEASSNLARYDGVHFGRRAENAKGPEEVYLQSRSEGFGAEVKRRIMAGTFVLSNEFYDDYYVKAQKVRRLIQDATSEILSSADVILSPTTFDVARKREKTVELIDAYATDMYTVHANLAGVPAVAIPQKTQIDGMPISFQLMGNFFEEKALFGYSQLIKKYSQ